MKRKVACEKEGFKTFESKRPRQAGRCLSIAMLFLLLVIPSLLFPQPLYDYVNYVRLLGLSSYHLRWGEKEPVTDDMVPLPPGYEDGSPRVYTGCYKIGTSGFSVAYSFKANFDAFVTVTVLDFENKFLYQKVTSFPTPPTGVVRLYGFSLPSYIEELRMIVQWAQWQPAVVIPVFVVLDEPKEPMNPAWVSVLRISCQWARGESTVEVAAIALTQKLWENGHYNGGNPGYTHYFRDANGLPIDDHERFYLKAFLEDTWFPYGQCNDFADFLVCLMISVGVPIDKARRTHQLLITDDTNFQTNWITPAGQAPTKAEWTYHQFVFTDRVWDGCLTLGEYGNFVVGMNFDSYKTGLVEAILRYDWQSAPPAGWFIPEVSAISANQMTPWPWAN
jgi:hypothetical protein